MSKSPTALIIFAHGSSVESANDAVREVAQKMAEAGGYRAAAAFLEGGKPDLQSAVAEIAGSGSRRIIVIPYFLTLGLHLQRDLPKLIEEAGAAHPELQIEVTAPLDGHPALVSILLDRASAAINGTSE